MAAPTGNGETPIRKFRAPDDEWVTAQEIAARRGETITDVLRRALQEYVRNGEYQLLPATSPAPTTEYRCACGRKFGSRNGRANHGRNCPQEQARSAAVIAEIEAGASRPGRK